MDGRSPEPALSAQVHLGLTGSLTGSEICKLTAKINFLHSMGQTQANSDSLEVCHSLKTTCTHLFRATSYKTEISFSHSLDLVHVVIKHLRVWVSSTPYGVGGVLVPEL